MEISEWFALRLSSLRMAKGVSARDMSLSLGQSESYINKIENKRILPSMSGFFAICEYLGVEPVDFFDKEQNYPGHKKDLAEKLASLTPEQADHIMSIISDITNK